MVQGRTQAKEATEDAEKGEKTPEEVQEEAGEFAKEKTIPCPELGGAFTFRLPHAWDEIKVLRRRAEIVALPEAVAGAELLGYAHATAMFQTYCVHQPREFDLDEMDLWTPFLAMMEEVRGWHETFRQRVAKEKESAGARSR